jgi:hypothetical protein
MKVSLAHVRVRSTSGGWIDYVVFDARSAAGSSSGNSALLAQLTASARSAGLKVDQSALAYMQNGRLQFFGTPNLVKHLSRSGLPRWTHEIDV